jgi:hypothetical protein
MTGLTGRRNVFAMMEPFLPLLLSRVGIRFEKMGDDIDYHGLRAPYFIRTESAVETMAPERRDLFSANRAEVAGSLDAASDVSLRHRFGSRRSQLSRRLSVQQRETPSSLAGKLDPQGSGHVQTLPQCDARNKT